MAINTGPQPVPATGNVTIIPASSVDRKPAPVPEGTPQVPAVPAPIPVSAIDSKPDPVPTPYSTSNITTTRPTTSTAAIEILPPPGPIIPNPPLPISIAVYSNGTLLTSSASSFNFTGNGVTTTANVRTNAVTVNITQEGSSGNANTGNIGFSNVTMYSLNGLAINNGDLSHGGTSGITLPANGEN